MSIFRRMAIGVTIVWACLLIGIGAASAGQRVMGVLWITDDAGNRVYGQYISVVLARKALPVPQDPGLAAMERHHRLDRINQLHLDFFKTFSAHRHQPGYLAAHTESSDGGQFAFLDVAPGDYFLVVTFPAMIGGYKVAWQQPVTVAAGRTVFVTLNDDNLILPTDRRH